MDRNSIIGLLLIFAIIMGYSWYTQPSKEEMARRQAERDSIAQVEQEQKLALKNDTTQDATVVEEETLVLDSGALASRHGLFSAHANKPLQIVELKNDKLKLSISNKGGKPVKAELTEYFVPDSSRHVNLFDSANASFGYQFNTRTHTVNTQNYYWDIAEQSDKAVVLRMYYGNKQKYLEQRYALKDGDYKVAYQFNVVGMQNEIPVNNNSMEVEFAQALPLQELELKAERRTATAWYKEVGESPDDMSITGEDEEVTEVATDWISFSQQFFNTTLIPEKPFDKGAKINIGEGGDEFVRTMAVNYAIPYNHNPSESFKMNLFLGPNKYYTLKKEGVELERLVPLGPVIIRHINKVVIYLFDLLKKLTTNYGIIILLMTIIIKTILFPLVYKSYKSMAKMKVLKPEMEAIKEKYEGDMQKIQQENMKLYKEAGVNPAGGCLPMIVQMPVLFAVFRFFPSAFELRQQSFLWAEDLSRFDSIVSWAADVPFLSTVYGNHVSLFTLLMTVTTLVYTSFNNQMSGATGQMKWIGYLMPIVFLGFFNNYASGLTYYYFVSTLITFGQQIVIRKFFIDEDKIRLQIAANKKNPKKKKTSSFQMRLEEMAKKQQEANKKRKK